MMAGQLAAVEVPAVELAALKLAALLAAPAAAMAPVGWTRSKKQGAASDTMIL